MSVDVVEKKSILFINGHLNAGGVERSLVDVLRHINFSRYEVDLLLTEGYGDYCDEIPADVHVEMMPLADAFGSFFTTMYILARHGRWRLFYYRLLVLLGKLSGNGVMRFARPVFRGLKSNYDVVIGYRPNNATTFAAYTFRAGKRISWWHHGEMNVPEGKPRKNLACAYLQMDNIVAVSESSARLVREAFPAVADKVCVVPNMLNVEEIQKKSKAESVVVNTDVVNIVTVGRMSKEKNMMFCVHVARMLKDRGFKYHWCIIGDGAEMKGILTEIRNVGVEKFFTLKGRMSNPYPYMASADILFHPSPVESQGLAVLEAMALGTLVVAVDSDGVREFLKDGYNGKLISNNVHEALDAILEIHNCNKMIPELINNANVTASQFMPDCIIKRISNVIERV